MLSIRRADNEDLKLILYFIDEAADWLRTKGTDQWAKPWPNEPERDARVVRGLRGGRTWIVEDDGVPVGTITCRREGNSELWSQQEQAEQSLYVSRLIVSRSYKGCGIGAELLDWAGLLAARQWEARWIRIDVWTTNTALHSFYEARGFSFVRLCDKVAYPSSALFQKPTAHIQTADVPRLKDTPQLIGDD
jgi:ribosomal protein S18 acetylase RimI-like enzyme